MSRLASTVLSLVLVGVIALAAYAGEVLVGAAVLLVQLLVATAPGIVDADGVQIPSPRAVPAVVAGVVATVLTLSPELLSGATGTSDDVVGASDSGMLAGILPAVAVALFVALLAQMLRRDGRTHLVQSVGYAVALSVVAALSAGWIGAVQSLGEADTVAVGAAGVAGGLVAWSVPIDRWVAFGLALVAGAAAGAGVAASVDAGMSVFFGMVVGAATGLFAVIGQLVGRTVARGHTHPAAAWGFPGAMAVAFAAPIVYIGGQLLTAPSF